MPEVNQLHQDLEGVDGHRPNHYQVVRGRQVRILTDKNKNKFNRQSDDDKVMKKSNIFCLKHLIQAWLSNICLIL